MNQNKQKMTLEKQLKKTQDLRIEAFSVIRYVSLKNPINYDAIREICETHSRICQKYAILLNENKYWNKRKLNK